MKVTMTAIALMLIAAPATAQHKTTHAPARRPAAAIAHPLPVFEFMSQNTETTTTMTMLNGKPCTQEKSDVLECTDMSDPIIAGQKLRWLSINYYKGKLYRVYGNTNKYSYGELLSAFTSKYGNPIISADKWQAKSGATFDNAVATWRFKGGNLVLESLGLDINTGQFSFDSDVNSPPAAPPKVDF